MNRKEQKRVMVIGAVGEGRLGAGEAAVGLGLSVRHVRRLLARYRKEGAAGVVYGNRGRRPYNKLDDAVRARVTELAVPLCSGCCSDLAMMRTMSCPAGTAGTKPSRLVESPRGALRWPPANLTLEVER